MKLMEIVKQAATAGREVVGIEVTMSNDDALYRITEYDAESGAIKVAKILEDGTTDSNEIVLSGINTMFAHFKYNPNPKPTADAAIVDGDLVIDNGPTVSLGSIKAQKVLGAVPGLVILGVGEPEDEELEVYTFNAQFSADPDFVGTFKDAGFTVPANTKAVVIDDRTYFIETVITPVEIKDKDGKVTDVKEICSSDLIQIMATGTGEDSTVRGVSFFGDNGEAMDYEDFCEENDLEEDTYDADEAYDAYLKEFGGSGSGFAVPIESVRMVEQAGRKDLVVVTKDTIDDDGYLTDEEQPTIRLFTMDGRKVGTFLVNSMDAKVYLGGSTKSAPSVTVFDKDQIFVRADKYGMKILKDPKIVEALEGHTVYCGKEYDEETKTATYYFGDEKQNVVGFSYRETDRGPVIKLVTEI
jgi:hypothetical protein